MSERHFGQPHPGHLGLHSGQDISEDAYYEHIVNSLDYGEMPATPVIDFVASNAEWERCKAALLRWIALHDEDDYSAE